MSTKTKNNSKSTKSSSTSSENLSRTIFNDGQWTESRFNSFVKSALRAASRRWPPKYQVLADASSGRLVSKRTGRLGKHYVCAKCGDNYPSSEVQVDHIKPIINPKKGFTTWDDVVNNMFCEKENLQVLCSDCHKTKTAQERKERKK